MYESAYLGVGSGTACKNAGSRGPNGSPGAFKGNKKFHKNMEKITKRVFSDICIN